MTAEGIYYFTVMATGTDGKTYQDTIAVTVLNKTQLDNLLKAKWEGMKTSLANQDIEKGLTFFLDQSKESYKKAFNTIIDNLPQIIYEMQHIEMIYAWDYIAKYRINRNHNIDGTPQMITYYVYFVKDSNGIWKINKF